MFTYIVLGILAILSPFVAFGVWNRVAAMMRRRAGRFGIFGVMLVLAGCDGPPEMMADGGMGGSAMADAGSDATHDCSPVVCPIGTVGSCDAPSPADCSVAVQPNGSEAMCCAPAACGGVAACPIGAFTGCALGDTTVECCSGGAVIQACARAFGTLTRECPVYGLTCDSGECAVDIGQQAVACCASYDPLDPCSQ